MGHFIKLLSTVAMLLIALNASAQERVKVSGTVTDKYEGGPVIGATVTWGDGKGTTTDIEGNYSITVDAGDTIRFMLFLLLFLQLLLFVQLVSSS